MSHPELRNCPGCGKEVYLASCTKQKYATRYICESGHIYYQRRNQVMLVDKLETKSSK